MAGLLILKLLSGCLLMLLTVFSCSPCGAKILFWNIRRKSINSFFGRLELRPTRKPTSAISRTLHVKDAKSELRMGK